MVQSSIYTFMHIFGENVRTHATNANLNPFSGLLKCLFTVCIVVFLWDCFRSALRSYISVSISLFLCMCYLSFPIKLCMEKKSARVWWTDWSHFWALHALSATPHNHTINIINNECIVNFYCGWINWKSFLFVFVFFSLLLSEKNACVSCCFSVCVLFIVRFGYVYRIFIQQMSEISCINLTFGAISSSMNV